ncbi:peroxiredoxin [Horticoccus luteus]|uniref:thioredoxin-dependent peroxiredoxin n=1 Tax=Horticoccus luteus TaxID=2862869 RepID=A0A8F9TX46_9BACT|nr:peroxiredoxin [Horticoccus luteus]QYM79157.1 peroxiredoxin [Horticoccus luteus]
MILKFFRVALPLAFAMIFSSAHAAPAKVGDPAPDVTGTTETGASLDFATVYKQQPYTLVYFFPKADTAGCTAQGCSLRDAYEKLTKKGVAVIGVSHDDVAAQKAFKDKNHFPFTLIADPDNTVIKAFGVPTYPMSAMAKRQAYLIKDGKIVWADYSASTDRQAADVLKVIDAQGTE